MESLCSGLNALYIEQDEQLLYTICYSLTEYIEDNPSILLSLLKDIPFNSKRILLAALSDNEYGCIDESILEYVLQFNSGLLIITDPFCIFNPSSYASY